MFDTSDLSPSFDCAGRRLILDRPRIMGVLNMTPDSFFDGGRLGDVEAAVRRALQMVEEGADIIDIGGESTRPGATAIGLQEELDRVLPAIERLAAEIAVPISIDTSKPEVMRAAVAAGAGLINDVWALRREGALAAAADLGVPICMMHMQGEPDTMQQAPVYDDVCAEVQRFLADRVFTCELAGIPRSRILADPGFGFGKTLVHNAELMGGLAQMADSLPPLLVGVSRKSMIGEITGRALPDRMVGSVVAAVLAAQRGARILRVHDVAATRDGLAILHALPQRTFSPSARSVTPRWGDED
jgi:dihydropteroate synthase